MHACAWLRSLQDINSDIQSAADYHSSSFKHPFIFKKKGKIKHIYNKEQNE